MTQAKSPATGEIPGGDSVGMDVPDATMKVSSNDDIEMIMNEIEQLQGGMKEVLSAPVASSAPVKEAVPVAAIPEPVTAAAEPTWLEEVYGKKPGEPSPEVAGILAAVAPVPSDSLGEAAAVSSELPVESSGSDGGSSDGDWLPEGSNSIGMNIQGNLTVRLRHERTGQTVSIAFLMHDVMISMGNGVELKFPVEGATVKSARPESQRPRPKVVA